MTERQQIAAYLRKLARNASSEQARGAYLYAAEGVEAGDYREGDRDA